MTDYITLSCPECGRQKEVLNMAGAKQLVCCASYVCIVTGVEDENFMLAPGHKVTYRKLVAVNVHPPIPVRSYDWQTFLDGDEDTGPHGWGETRHDAVVDLLVEIEDKMEIGR